MIKNKSTKTSYLTQYITAFVASIFALTAWATPDQDPFYFTKPNPGDISGDIIDVRESIFTVDPFSKTPYPGVNAWQVIYQSENATGEVIAVSGTILVPTHSYSWPDNVRPIIGYSVGTRGLGDACAPSYTLSQGYDYDSLRLSRLLKRGWAVVISDYEGLGTPGDHTYMVGPSQGRVALDIVRAAQRLPQAGLSSDAPVILMGYSQGGAAAGWASEISSEYAPEINIIASVLGGVPADLEATGRFLDGKAFAGLALMATVGLDAAYEEINLTEVLKEEGLELLSHSKNMCIIGLEEIETKLRSLFSHFTDFAMINPVDDPVWQHIMAKSKLGNIKPTMPVYLYHGIFDRIAPYGQAAKLRKDWCDLGAVVEWHPLLKGHLTSHTRLERKRAIGWMARRFAGIPVSDNCPHSF
jgi:pimeloyl-ACP methyl ester carboxylesterase